MDESQQTQGSAPGEGEQKQAGGRPSIDVQRMVAQLQAMISEVATASTPTLKLVAAKAAELAAAAADRAGPLAQGIADRTERAGHAVADRATKLATDLRAPNAAPGADAEPGEAASAEPAQAPAQTPADDGAPE